MNLLPFFESLDALLALIATILFFGVSIILTLKTRFMQLWAFPKFIKLLTQGIKSSRQAGVQTMSSYHALFTAMGTTIGMGNVVGPSMAIVMGGPGALFWLLVYIFFSSVTKFTEVTFALKTRIKFADGQVIGGPMQYLKGVSPALAYMYVVMMMFLMVGFSATQSNTLAQIFAQNSVPNWVVGLALSGIIFFVLQGGARSVGDAASKLVPLMFVLYVSFSLSILLSDLAALKSALNLVLHSIFNPAAAVGGFVGANIFAAIQYGAFKGVFITEAGIGTSSIPHAVADTKQPTDQGILALYSMMSDAFLCTISGLLILVTGVWTQGDGSTLVYEAFKLHSSEFGRIALLASITLFVLTTVIGNSFNGVQSFSFLMRNEGARGVGINWYVVFTMLMVFAGSLVKSEIVWKSMDIVLIFVAIPNLIGLLVLAFREPEVLEIK